MDIQTKADAIKVLADLKAEQKRLADSNRSLTENLEKKSADLKAVSQKLGELSAIKPVTVSDRESTLRRFVRDDGSLDMHGMVSDETDRGQWHQELKQLVDDRNLTKLMTKRGNVDKLDRKIADHFKSAPVDIRRAFSDSSGVGAEFIPDLLLPQMMQKLYNAGNVENLFPSMQMPGKEVRLPFLTLKVKPFLKSGATYGTITAEDDVTSQISMTAKSFAARITLDEDASVDSIVSGLEIARSSLATSMAHAIEDAIINGDTAGTHQDTITGWSPRGRWNSSGLGGSDDHRSAFLGLRAQAFDVSSAHDPGAVTFAALMSTRAQLEGAHGVGSNLALIVSPEYYLLHLLDMEQVATVDKFGPQAVVLQGSVAAVGGGSVIISDFLTADLASSGLFTGSGTTTGYLWVNRDAYMVGNYKPVTVDIDREIVNGTIETVVTRRVAFQCMEAANKTVAFGYNIASS